MKLTLLDISVAAAYMLVIMFVGIWRSLDRHGNAKNTQSYFLAGRSLRWWNVGASLIAVNITAALVVSMSGAGYALGIAVASYEWLGGIALLLIGKYFLPVYLRARVSTLPQFLALRYSRTVSFIMTIIWILIYVSIGLTSLLWLAATVLERLTGLGIMPSLLLLGFIAVSYSLYGGLKSISLVDVIQVCMLIIGGVLISWYALVALGEGQGVLPGLAALAEKAPDRFDLILPPEHPHWRYLPGLSVLFGGMWVMQISYWGVNQYIMQRAFAARNLAEAQNGMLFAAWLKLPLSILIILPGMAAWILFPNLPHADHSYPAILSVAPAGVRGLIFASLIGAAVSATGSLLNSIATLITLNLYKPLFPGKTQAHLLRIGRISVVASLFVAIWLAPLMFGHTEHSFQSIQNFTSHFSPGLVTLFLIALYWKRPTVPAAIFALIFGPTLSWLFETIYPQIPFMNRAGYVFLICTVGAIFISLHTAPNKYSMPISRDFSTSTLYKIGSFSYLLVIAALYWHWW